MSAARDELPSGSILVASCLYLLPKQREVKWCLSADARLKVTSCQNSSILPATLRSPRARECRIPSSMVSDPKTRFELELFTLRLSGDYLQCRSTILERLIRDQIDQHRSHFPRNGTYVLFWTSETLQMLIAFTIQRNLASCDSLHCCCLQVRVVRVWFQRTLFTGGSGSCSV